MSAFAWILILLFFNIYPPHFREKTNFAATFKEINKLAGKEDYVYAKTPIGFLESAYYFRNEAKTFVYNPENIHIPNYIGVNVLFPEVSRATIPSAPAKVFMVNDDASYEIIEIR